MNSRILHVIFYFLLVAVSAAPAFAGDQCFSDQQMRTGQCYSTEQLRAEQLLRLHSELMVITVTCKQGSKGENLVPAYTGFTNRNLKALHDADQTMISYYHTVFGGSGIDRLDKLRTKLGNEFGQKMADASAPVYCRDNRDMVLTYYRVTPAQLQAEVEHMIVADDSYGHLCTAAAAAATRLAKNSR